MKAFRKICKENGIEKYSSVVATVNGYCEDGTYAVVDGCGLETVYNGVTQKIGCKVLLTVDHINEDSRQIYATFEHSFTDDRAA